jgi:hypothetical protein
VSTNATTSNTYQLGIEYIGTLDFNKWLSLVRADLNNGSPCTNGTVAAAAADAQHTGSMQTNTDTKTVYPVVTVALLKPPGNFSYQYAVCYAEIDGSATDIWYDSGVRLRMARWINPANFRHASGSNSKLFFEINDGTMYQDHMVLIRNSADGTCGNAPTATNTFNGDTVRRYIAADHSTTLPSVALAGDGRDLDEGTYIMCLCNRQNLDNGRDNGDCNTVNEFTLIIGVSFKIVEKPRLGQFNGTGVYGQDIRGVSGFAHNYALKGSKTTGLTLKNSDKLFFSTTCSVVPGAPQDDASVPGNVFEFVDLTGAAVVTKPASLLSDGSSSRQLYACYATEESLTNNDNKAAAYITLQDVLIIVPMPRLGIPATPGHIRVVTGATPDFQITQAAQGDKISSLIQMWVVKPYQPL